jgi:hypothetical protein
MKQNEENEKKFLGQMKPISLLLKKDIDLEKKNETDVKEPSYKEPFPNRIGKNVDGAWNIPNVTTTSETSLSANTTSKKSS